jgi:methyl-accepting chemotaxis protein
MPRLIRRRDPIVQILRSLRRVERQGARIMADVGRLQQAVTDNTLAVNAAVAKIAEGSTPSQAQLDQLAGEVESNTSSLNAAVAPPAPPA